MREENLGMKNIGFKGSGVKELKNFKLCISGFFLLGYWVLPILSE